MKTMEIDSDIDSDDDDDINNARIKYCQIVVKFYKLPWT
jgi:hypothetical protein